ncbi:putative xyloglucan endotransglucosylase/hydrolase protein 26 [Bienertia sinuspersici]
MGNLRTILIAFFASAIALQICSVCATFMDGTVFYWGAQRGRYTGPDSVELKLDSYGGTGIKSTSGYMYGSITMGIKLPSGNSAGTVTTFYLASEGEGWDEIDFEFLGNVTGEPYTIHTNIYTKGFGQREQQFKPWFNPDDGYHYYTIMWLVDDVPIRVFRNYHDSEINYPDAQPMQAYSSFWNADDWATQGGRVKTDWDLAPFTASLQNYKVDACYCSDHSCVGRCSAKTYDNWWTNQKFYKLDEEKNQQMKDIQYNYMIYNYCTDYARFNGSYPKECSLPQY